MSPISYSVASPTAVPAAIQIPVSNAIPIPPKTGTQDRMLRMRARLEARMDRTLGQALDALRAKKVYKELGFVRFSDYVRETLGISLRSAQQMIHTERLLRKLPEIAASWDEGR